MNKLIKQIKELKKTFVRSKVNKRLKEFELVGRKSSKSWFSELCFCLLTANSKAFSAIKIQNDLGVKGFCDYSASDVKECIMKHKHRFHNNKTNFIIEARKYVGIKEIVRGLDEFEAREWLVKHIKGLGYKESSHFLRNVGYKNLAILDRHILNLMVENDFIKEKPKSLSRATYLKIEKVFISIADGLGMSVSELDLYMWYLKTGEILK